MAEDIVPKLYEKIQAEFKKNIGSNSRIRDFQSRGKHTAKEVSLYADDVGNCVSKTLLECLTEENLPNGILYWNIAERTITPLLKTAYEMVIEEAEKMQRQQDEEIGIQIKPVRPEFPEERVKGFLNKLIEFQEDDRGDKQI